MCSIMGGKLNVLYVIPRYETYCMANHYVMPLGILYVSAYVKRAGVAHVHTLNLNHVEGKEFDILASCLTNHQINVVGLGGLSGEYTDISRMAQYVKRINRETYVVVGGGIMTADPKTTMKAMPEVDFGIIGEGELTMTELLAALGTGSNVELVNGLIIRKGSVLKVTPRRKEIVDLDSLPFPDYEGFNYGEYLKANPDLSDEGKNYSQVSVIGGRSCKYNCTFCFHPSGATYRQRSLDSIFAEIDYLVEHYDISYIALREELFATDNRRVADFCRRVKLYDFDWSIQLRIDSINQELVDLLKDTRCRYVFVGVESASDVVLRSMRKGITLKQIEAALDMLKEAGIHSRSGVIFGDTAETYDTALFTLDWYKQHCDRYRIYKRACSSGIITDPVKFLQDGCPIVNASKMDNRQFSDLVCKIEKVNSRKYNVKYYNGRNE